MSEALKDDKEKLRYDLVPPVELEGMVKILTFGATKYGPNNWQQADKIFVQRVLAANMRHEAEIRKGNLVDEESGELHAYHMMCNSLFLAWYGNHRPELFDLGADAGKAPEPVNTNQAVTRTYAGSHHVKHALTAMISWHEFDIMVSKLLTSLTSQFGEGSFDCVLYVPRGGKEPAKRIAQKLKLPMGALKDAEWKDRGYKHILVVDDINDTGNTLWTIMEEKQEDWNITFATVVKRHSSTCDFAWFGHLEMTDNYLIFPWEADNVGDN